MTENCCQLDPAHVHWENPNHIAMPTLMWLKDLIQRMNFALAVNELVYSERCWETMVEGGAETTKAGAVAWELHIQQEKKPKAQDFQCKVRFWLQSRFWHQSDNPLLKHRDSTWIFLHSRVTHISLAARTADLLHLCGTKAWHAFAFPLASNLQRSHFKFCWDIAGRLYNQTHLDSPQDQGGPASTTRSAILPETQKHGLAKRLITGFFDIVMMGMSSLAKTKHMKYCLLCSLLHPLRKHCWSICKPTTFRFVFTWRLGFI